MTEQNGQIEADDEPPAAGLLEDVRDCLMFLTRLPMPEQQEGRYRQLSNAVRGFPVAGALIGAIGGLALLAAQGAGLPAMVAACIAVVAIVMVTGGLHEDGLADVADGFGAGGSRERKLEIMRDSRIGTYGVLALVFAILIKVTCISVLLNAAQSVWHVPMLLVATGSLSRTFIVLAMRSMPVARSDGRSVEAGVPTGSGANQALVAGLAIGSIMMWLACGLWTMAATLLAGAAAYYLAKRRALHHVGGQTGDVLGAIQQLTEIAMFVALAATYC
ncbi:MAG: adenosylcobinamide-GDP ribazoletransferase [Rhizobiales bacterium]|nr:adenosylcobinamide-GDP ribazoletransferase [Hyphomicrobiales bacterium]